MSAQKHFLADAAHQLKTPLAGLRMQAELAQREIDAGEHDPQALKRSLQQIAHASERAAHMVNQLLAMARAETWAQHRSALSTAIADATKRARRRWCSLRPRLGGRRSLTPFRAARAQPKA